MARLAVAYLIYHLAAGSHEHHSNRVHYAVADTNGQQSPTAANWNRQQREVSVAGLKAFVTQAYQAYRDSH